MSMNDKNKNNRNNDDVFRKVDDRVAKPVLGSDGAARWQEFRATASSSTTANNNNNNSIPQRHLTGSKRNGVAPMAPLKALDRASTGMQHWHDERQRENETRTQQGLPTLEEASLTVYTHFRRRPGKDGSGDDGNDKEGKQDKEEPLSNLQPERSQQEQQEGRQPSDSATTTNTTTTRRRRRRSRPEGKEYYISSPMFQGSKSNYIFTTRQGYGTGYFWDEFYGEDAEEDDEDAEVKSNNNKKKKKKTKKVKHRNGSTTSSGGGGGGGSVVMASVSIPSDPQHPLEQVAVALQRRDQLLQQRQQQQQFPPNQNRRQAQEQPREHDDINNNNLPKGWLAAQDPTSQKLYYYCTATGKTTWEKPWSNNRTTTLQHDNDDYSPDNPMSTKTTNEVQKMNPDHDKTFTNHNTHHDDDNEEEDHDATRIPPGWIETKDPNTGKVYYYHTQTQQVQWDRPTSSTTTTSVASPSTND